MSAADQSPQITSNHSRQTSAAMAPPPVPQNSSLPSSPRPPPVTMDSSSYVGTAGPIRHPRPLTAAELHLELEKEQESIVNRLTRELSALRAQTASVASTASSTSDLFTSNTLDSHPYHYQSGITPTSARRHRSSSNLSSRSARDALANSASVTSVSGVTAPRDRDRDRDTRDGANPAAPHSSSRQASSRPSIEILRPDVSRQNSTSATGYRSLSSTNTTTTGQSQSQSQPQGYHYPSSSSARHSISSLHGADSTSPIQHHHHHHHHHQSSSSTSHLARSPSSTFAAASAARYEEAATQRAELEAVKKENEALKVRVRELERSLSLGLGSVGSGGEGVTTNGAGGG